MKVSTQYFSIWLQVAWLLCIRCIVGQQSFNFDYVINQNGHVQIGRFVRPGQYQNAQQLVNHRYTFWEGDQACKNMGYVGGLASIHNETESQIAWEILSIGKNDINIYGSYSLYLGMERDPTNPSQFRWIDGTCWDYEPNWEICGGGRSPQETINTNKNCSHPNRIRYDDEIFWEVVDWCDTEYLWLLCQTEIPNNHEPCQPAIPALDRGSQIKWRAKFDVVTGVSSSLSDLQTQQLIGAANQFIDCDANNHGFGLMTIDNISFFFDDNSTYDNQYCPYDYWYDYYCTGKYYYGWYNRELIPGDKILTATVEFSGTNCSDLINLEWLYPSYYVIWAWYELSSIIQENLVALPISIVEQFGCMITPSPTIAPTNAPTIDVTYSVVVKSIINSSDSTQDISSGILQEVATTTEIALTNRTTGTVQVGAGTNNVNPRRMQESSSNNTLQILLDIKGDNINDGQWMLTDLISDHSTVADIVVNALQSVNISVFNVVPASGGFANSSGIEAIFEVEFSFSANVTLAICETNKIIIAQAIASIWNVSESSVVVVCSQITTTRRRRTSRRLLQESSSGVNIDVQLTVNDIGFVQKSKDLLATTTDSENGITTSQFTQQFIEQVAQANIEFPSQISITSLPSISASNECPNIRMFDQQSPPNIIDFLSTNFTDLNGISNYHFEIYLPYICGLTYVIDFALFSNDIRVFGTCANRELNDFLSVEWQDIWKCSQSPFNSQDIGSFNYLSYPPSSHWQMEMIDDCNTIKYSANFTFNDLLNCAGPYDAWILERKKDKSRPKGFVYSGGLYVTAVAPYSMIMENDQYYSYSFKPFSFTQYQERVAGDPNTGYSQGGNQQHSN